MPVFDEFHEQHPALHVQWLYPEVVQDQDVQLFQAEHFLDCRAVDFGHLELGEQPGGVGVEDFVSFAAGLVAQGTGKVAFARACASCQQDVFSFFDVSAVGKAQELVFVQLPSGTEVELLDGGLVTEPCAAQVALHAAVLAVVPLVFHQQADEFIGGQVRH